MTTYKTRLGLDARCIHCNKRPHEHTGMTWECVQERKPYTAPKLRKLDPRCIKAHERHAKDFPDEELCHVPDCKCDK